MPRYPLTRKQEAERLGMSERYVDMYRAVRRLRPDLVTEVDGGFYSVNMAYEIAMGREPVLNSSTTWLSLCRAWNKCSQDERMAFIKEIGLKPPE